MGLFKKKQSVNEILVCPRCASTEKEHCKSLPQNYTDGFDLISNSPNSIIYRCMNCGFEGTFLLVAETMLETMKNDILSFE
ncbi:MAG: hypothetical protein KKF44_10765 [Nanoarchaeota archaeon]|nr:hypothetical protein [Nanoarchaeota archaeon]